MKSYRKELWMEVPARRGFVNITPEVERCLAASGVREGLVLVNAMHITASVFINDDESGLHADMEKWLEKLAPEKPHSQYRHNGAEDNADAHLKRTIMGREVVVAIIGGQTGFWALGTDLLRRVRRRPPQTGDGQDHRRVNLSLSLRSKSWGAWVRTIRNVALSRSACVHWDIFRIHFWEAGGMPLLSAGRFAGGTVVKGLARML